RDAPCRQGGGPKPGGYRDHRGCPDRALGDRGAGQAGRDASGRPRQLGRGAPGASADARRRAPLRTSGDRAFAQLRRRPTVAYGVVMFPTEYAIAPEELARALEDRGFESVWFPERTHITASRATRWPARSYLPT